MQMHKTDVSGRGIVDICEYISLPLFGSDYDRFGVVFQHCLILLFYYLCLLETPLKAELRHLIFKVAFEHQGFSAQYLAHLRYDLAVILHVHKSTTHPPAFLNMVVETESVLIACYTLFIEIMAA